MPDPVQFRGRAASDDARRAAIAAGLIVGLIAIALVKPWDVLLSGPPSPSASPAAASPPTATPLPSPVEAAPDLAGQLRPFGLQAPPTGLDWSSLRWEALPRDHPVTSFRLVTHGPAGDVAVGAGLPQSTPVWRSTDAANWDPVPFNMPDTFWQGSAIVAATSSASGALLIAGLRTADACVTATSCPFLSSLDAWTSADGLRWSVSHINGFAPPSIPPAVQVAAIGSTVVVLGPASTLSPSTRIAVSVAGGPWALLPDDALPSDFVVTDVASLRGRLVATGRTADATGASRAAVATSTDGRRWTVSLLPSGSGAATGGEPAVASHIAAGPDGLLVTGSTGGGPGADAWWHSTDGVSWTVATGFPPVGPRTCQSADASCGPAADGLVLGDGTRIVASGFLDDGPGVSVWTSADGSGWRRLAAPAGGPTGRLELMTLLPGGVVVWVDGAPWYGAAVAATG